MATMVSEQKAEQKDKIVDDREKDTLYKNPKKAFRKLGSCSRTFFYLLDREFGHPQETEEHAADPLAGGILEKGYQCGMLWGSSLAIGSEAYRRCETIDQAIGVAILATRQVMISFSEREGSINCRDITDCDFSNTLSFARYFLSGRFLHCFRLAEQWAPEAVRIAMEALSTDKSKIPQQVMSCASEVARRMGANDEEVVTVAGFAGGLGLSSGGCGALSAAIWMKSLAWCREHPTGMAIKNPGAQLLLKTFEELTDSRFLCSEVSGQRFRNLDQHTNFIQSGGCGKVLDTLAQL